MKYENVIFHTLLIFILLLRAFTDVMRICGYHGTNDEEKIENISCIYEALSVLHILHPRSNPVRARVITGLHKFQPAPVSKEKRPFDNDLFCSSKKFFK